ncbi:hypothetical protein V7127_22630 [Bacillus sp. JJ1773]|uniref:hypothetical protein n=1 Tax=Bacillus sp. JJ1773 TaxID=3122965 RepID=UPI002FFE1598
MIKMVIVDQYNMDQYHEIGSFPPAEVEEVISLIEKYGVIFETDKTEHYWLIQAVFNVTMKHLALIVGPE